MRTFLVIAMLFHLLPGLRASAQVQQVVVLYTLADRDRTIRAEAKMETLETKFEALESKMNVKSEAVNARIDYLFWLQGVIVALILFMLG